MENVSNSERKLSPKKIFVAILKGVVIAVVLIGCVAAFAGALVLSIRL